jgi:hypothetical protein
VTTAAAIDRLVHHSVIIELNIPSYRAEAAKKALRQKARREQAQRVRGEEGRRARGEF